MLDLMIEPYSRLVAITELLDALHEHDISYCHWKSNEHLAASMTGDTDLDMLFDVNQKLTIESIFDRLAFKRFNAIREKHYEEIVDFLGLDLQSGKIIHIHTHYKLTVGEPYLKGYQLDLEKQILNSRVYNDEFGIYCIQPAWELILLFMRESLKFRHRDVFRMRMQHKIQYPENILREYRWLKERTTNSEIHYIITNTFKNHDRLYKAMVGEFNRKKIYQLAPIVKDELKDKRLFSPTKALFLRWYREASILTSRKLARLLSRPILYRRINPRGGSIVAVVGADGSGKSTVTENLLKTFAQKLDVFKFYFGRGDGTISMGRKILLSVKNYKVHNKNNLQIDKKPNSIPKSNKGLMQTIYKSMEALLIAYEKHNNLKKIREAKNKGALVICDRYPQNQVSGYNDGPLLTHLKCSKNPLFRILAKVESKVYEQAENNPPDILFKLIADAEVVEQRKPGETSLEKLNAKISGIKELKLNERCRVITVDAAQPLPEVLYVIKKELWKIL